MFNVVSVEGTAMTTNNVFPDTCTCIYHLYYWKYNDALCTFKLTKIIAKQTSKAKFQCVLETRNDMMVFCSSYKTLLYITIRCLCM